MDEKLLEIPGNFKMFLAPDKDFKSFVVDCRTAAEKESSSLNIGNTFNKEF